MHKRAHLLKNAIFRIAVIVLPFIFIVIGGEITFRLYRCIKPLTAQNAKPPIIFDERRGWRATPNYEYNGTMRDAQGTPYKVEIRTNQEGFRLFGNLQSTRPKILFIGDSYTHAQQISNEKTYYDLLQKSKIMEVFAYGTSGYGTLQEFMILDRYFDRIKPDVIVFQYCLNDFVNNSYELELRSSWNNIGKRRPYLTKDGELFYAIPKTHFAQVRDCISRYSLFMSSLFWRLDKLYAEFHKQTTIERIIQQKKGQIELFRDAVHITDRILKRTRERVDHQVPIYVFAADDSVPFYETFKALAFQNNIVFIEGIPQALRKAKEQGIVTKAADGVHWSEAGHAIVANQLLHHFRSMIEER